ncbi:ABC transporter permease [Halobacteriovorax sp. ZH5_bin.2]|uniref:ABC transporter permease n=1 Tax=Halobacteriovorax sp. ZH5_bin.2 TaxID=3157727 RepID=UPI003721D776
MKLKMVMRELRSSPMFFIIFILNLSIGMVGLSTIEVFKSSFDSALTAKSKTLLGSDISVSSRIAITKDSLEIAKSNLDYSEMTRNRSLYSMLFNGEKSRLVNIRGLGTGFPFYGDIISKRGKSFKEIKDNEVFIYPELVGQLGLDVGKEIKIGSKIFKVAGIVEEDGSAGFSMGQLAPRLYLKNEVLDSTDLIKPGSTIWRSLHFKMAKELSDKELIKTEKDLKAKIIDSSIRIRSPQSNSERVGRSMDYLADFLGLVSLCGLFLAGLGLIYLFRGFLLKRRKDLAILGFIGMKKKDIFKIYTLKLFFLGLFGSLLGIAIGTAFSPVIQSMVSRNLGINFELDFNLSTFFVTMAVGVASTIVLAPALIIPYLRVDQKALFDHDTSLSKNFYDYLLFIPIVLFYWVMAIYLSESLIVGSAFIAVFLLIVGVFFPVGSFVLSWLGKLNPKLSLSSNMAFKYVTRHKISTLFIFLCLFISTSLMTLIPSVKNIIGAELSMPAEERPVYFLFDIQPEQVEDLKTFVSDKKLELLNISPMVRGRLVKINGEGYNPDKLSDLTREEQREQRSRNRSANLSYRDHLVRGEEIVEGRMPKRFDFESDEVAEVSLEQRYASRLGINLGDELEYNILGMPIIAKVVGLRSIRWTSFLPNFFISFGPGVLEDAPKTFIAAIGKGDGVVNDQLQSDFAARFQNVSLIDIQSSLKRVATIMESITKILVTMSFIVFLVGLLVIYSLIAHQLESRREDISLINIIGIRFSEIRKSIMKEMALMSVSAVVVGITLGQLVTYAVAKLQFDLNYIFSSVEIFGFAILIIVLSILISFSSFNRFIRK